MVWNNYVISEIDAIPRTGEIKVSKEMAIDNKIIANYFIKKLNV